MRWLFFIAIIWPVRAEATKTVSPKLAEVLSTKTVSAKAVPAKKVIYWQSANFNKYLLMHKSENKNICQIKFIKKYFNAEAKVTQFFLLYLKHNTQNLKSLYAELNFLLKNKTNQNKWNKNNLGLNNLLDYYDLIYDISDRLSVFFTQLNICWEKRSSSFVDLKKIIKKYRTQDEISAEIIIYFFNQLDQAIRQLQNKNLSQVDKIKNLNAIKQILDNSIKMEKLLNNNYKILSEQLNYTKQIYWGL